METKRGKGRPPREGGPRKSTSIRADVDLLTDVELIAKELGETVSAVAERGLLEYRARHRDLLDKLRERAAD